MGKRKDRRWWWHTVQASCSLWRPSWGYSTAEETAPGPPTPSWQEWLSAALLAWQSKLKSRRTRRKVYWKSHWWWDSPYWVTHGSPHLQRYHLTAEQQGRCFQQWNLWKISHNKYIHIYHNLQLPSVWNSIGNYCLTIVVLLPIRI